MKSLDPSSLFTGCRCGFSYMGLDQSMDPTGLCQHCSSFIWCFPGINILDTTKMVPPFYLNFYGCRLLVYTQRKCNKQLCVLMALSFYLQFTIATLTPFITPGDDLTFLDYWVAFCHPVSRLPVFFMGICAGLLCVRIQEGDLNAINGMMRKL